MGAQFWRKNMKILHISSGGIHEGASRGALFLHEALIELGFNSKFICTDSSLKHDNIFSINASNFRYYFLKFINKLNNFLLFILYPNKSKVIFSLSLFGYDITKHPEYADSDIIHLHWINGALGLFDISKIEKPIIWTIRDMWPFTGGCHVGAIFNCNQYINACGKCPQLNSKVTFDVSRILILLKKNSYNKNIILVGVSDWISRCLKNSYLFNENKIFTINNGIDLNIFYPEDKANSRKLLNLPLDKKIILAGAQSISDSWKGIDLLFESINYLKDRDFILVFFGGDLNSREIDLEKFQVHNFGYIKDNAFLRTLYSAADVFVAPSRVESFGKTLAESLACATPVVCFDATGTSEVIEHLETGYKAQAYDPFDMATGISLLINLDEVKLRKMRNSCRKRALSKYDVRLIALKYAEIYTSYL